MSCCCNRTKGKPWWKRLWEGIAGSEDANHSRAVKYFRAQLCGMGEHQLALGPAPGVKRCEWCRALVERKEAMDIVRDWAHAVDVATVETAAMGGFAGAMLHADEPTAKLHIRKPGPVVRGKLTTLGQAGHRFGISAVIQSLRGWKMRQPEADRIWLEFIKRAPEGWKPPAPKKAKRRVRRH